MESTPADGLSPRSSVGGTPRVAWPLVATAPWLLILGLSASVAAQPVERVSISDTGAQANGYSSSPAVSGNGRYVAFASRATNLVTGYVPAVTSPPPAEIYVRDRVAGRTVLVSLASDRSPANADCESPSISLDGRFIVFRSGATNLVAGDTNAEPDIFLHDRDTDEDDVFDEPGAVTTERVSVRAGGGQSPSASFRGSISADGRAIAFDTTASLDPVRDRNEVSDAYVFDRATRIIEPVSVNAAGTTGIGATFLGSGQQALSADGRYVGFFSTGQPFLRDRLTGTTEMIAPLATPTQYYVALVVAGQGDAVVAALVRVCIYCYGTWPLLSISLHVPSGNEGSRFGAVGRADTPRFSADGRTLFFNSLPSGPGAGRPVVLNRFTGLEADLSAITGKFQEARLGGDDLVLAFTSGDTGLVANDTNSAFDVFVALLDEDGDGLPRAWEEAFGLDPTDPHDAGHDLDEDGRSNLAEYVAGTHPRGLYTRYMAEGATTPWFNTQIALANPGGVAAHVQLSFMGTDGRVIRQTALVAPLGRRTILSAGLGEFSTVVESDVPVVADRLMTWSTWGGGSWWPGSHADTGQPAPATDWYLAEGATHSDFDLFYLLQNPADTPAEVRVTYLLPAPAAPLTRDYLVAPHSRFNIWVDLEDGRLANTDVSAIVRARNGVAIVVERALYLSRGDLAFVAGHAAAAVPAPLRDWYFAEGATGPYFDTFLLVADPTDTPATVTVTYYRPSGPPIVRTHTVAARSRLTIWVDHEDDALADSAVAMRVQADVPVVAERAMWWPGAVGQWEGAHCSAGATRTATRWAMAAGALGTSGGPDTYVLVANPGSPNGGNLGPAAAVRVTLLPEAGAWTEPPCVAEPCVPGSRSRVFTVGAGGRLNVNIWDAFWPGRTTTDPLNISFGVLVESLPPVADAPATPVVVEWARYCCNDVPPVWRSGAGALAVPLLQVHEDETGFVRETGATHVASFDTLDVGVYGPELQVGDLRVRTTDGGGLPIFGPVPPAFAGNTLQKGVASNAADLVVSFPPGTTAAGFQVLAPSGRPIVVIAIDADGVSAVATLEATSARFVGFTSPAGLTTVRITSPPTSTTPIVTLGGILYAREP